MRKIVMFNMVPLDGYFAGVDGNIDWHVTDKEFDRLAVEMHKNFDTILFGRVTYELFESFWRTHYRIRQYQMMIASLPGLYKTPEKLCFQIH